MEHEIPLSNTHLLFCAPLDGEYQPSPYPAPTVSHWTEDKPFLPTVKFYWTEPGVEFATEFPDWIGKVGKTMRLQRRLVSSAVLHMTVCVMEGEKVVVGPCYTTMKKIGTTGPQPAQWLRKAGKSLKTAEARKEALDGMKRLIQENIDIFSEAHEKDRVFPSKFNGVAGMCLHGLSAYESLVEPWLTPETLPDAGPAPLRAGVDAEFVVLNEPKGVCLNISPWNAPVQLSLIPVMAMLASGNHAIIKPPDMVPTVSALLRRLVQKYLHGYVWVEEGGRETVERLIDDGLDHVIFTGGGEIAKHVAARCGRNLTPVTLELGGKSPVFVDQGLSEEMLDAVVRETLQLKVVKTGQFCCAHDYYLVHESIQKDLLAKLQAELEQLGDKRNVHIIGERQYKALKARLEEAQEGAEAVIPPLAGACVLNDEAWSIPATAILNPKAECSLLTQEIFGPLLPIVTVKDAAAAIAHVNALPCGKPLIAYCYTQDSAVADAFIAGTGSGNVAVNSGPQRLLANTAVGFGGAGQSGSGVSLWGREAMREYTNRRHVIRAKAGFAKSFFSGPPPQV
jgi:aldehyde dehydrogenase (NAD+)